MEYKFVELMSLQYTRSPEDIVQHQITYRYNAMKVGPSTAKILENHVPNADKVKSSLYLTSRYVLELSHHNFPADAKRERRRGHE